MSTRSYIGIEDNDGTIMAIYCHWDGYPEWVGKILYNCYNTRDRVSLLINQGHLSCLKENIFDCEFYANMGEDLEMDSYPDRKMYATINTDFIYLFTKDNNWIYWEDHSSPRNLGEILERNWRIKDA